MSPKEFREALAVLLTTRICAVLRVTDTETVLLSEVRQILDTYGDALRPDRPQDRWRAEAALDADEHARARRVQEAVTRQHLLDVAARASLTGQRAAGHDGRLRAPRTAGEVAQAAYDDAEALWVERERRRG